MSAILSWVFALFEKIPARVLGGLGFGWATYAGYSAAVESFIGSAVSSIQSTGGVLYSILSMTGFIDGFGIILGAISARAALQFIDKLAKIG